MALRMWPYLPELLATPVPRYTSFPTAADFNDGVGADDLEAAIGNASGDVSIYVHIPFCHSICWYCGCNTGRANRAGRLAGYLDAVHREIALVGGLLSPAARIARIAFGGGSPNAIAPAEFVRLVTALIGSLRAADPEFSVELDPRSLDAAWGEVLKTVGVTRASLGVQTFSPRLQQAIGRVQSAEIIARCTAMLREAGVTSLNFDLMYGLPGQTLDDVRASLDESIRLGADRIALFGYAHVPQLIPRQRQIDGTALPDQAARFEMAAQGHEWLLQAGYVPIGFDHFARPGDPLAQASRDGRLRRNFQGFTDDQASCLIGIGASAISAFPHLLAQNEKNAGRYAERLSEGRLTAAHGCKRSDDDRAHGTIIEALLCMGRADLQDCLTGDIESRLNPFICRGLARIEGSRLVIEPHALPYSRVIAAIFDPYRQVSTRQFSSAV